MITKYVFKVISIPGEPFKVDPVTTTSWCHEKYGPAQCKKYYKDPPSDFKLSENGWYYIYDVDDSPSYEIGFENESQFTEFMLRFG